MPIVLFSTLCVDVLASLPLKQSPVVRLGGVHRERLRRRATLPACVQASSASTHRAATRGVCDGQIPGHCHGVRERR